MTKETKEILIRVIATCIISAIAIGLMGDAGLIITFLAFILMIR